MPAAPIRTWKCDGYRLDVFDLNRTDSLGKALLTYKLTHNGTVLFPEGDRFGCSPLHAPDSDATVAAILSFCLLRPGDTDAEYFAHYSPRQLVWVSRYGEELSFLAADLEETSRSFQPS